MGSTHDMLDDSVGVAKERILRKRGGYCHYQLSGQKNNLTCVGSANSKVGSDNSNTHTRNVLSKKKMIGLNLSMLI